MANDTKIDNFIIEETDNNKQIAKQVELLQKRLEDLPAPDPKVKGQDYLIHIQPWLDKLDRKSVV